MAYIYYISRIKQTNRGGYVGQDIGDIFNENNRIVQHAKIAYGLSSKKLYGSEILMRQNSLSGLYYRIYDSESDCFGVGQEAFEEFSRFWEHSKGGVAAKLDFAELCHIFIGNFESSFANANLRIGGQNIWTFKQEGLLVLAEQVDDLKRKKSPLSYVELLGRNNGELGKLTIHFPDGIAEGVKVFEPQGYIIARLIANGVTEHFLSDSDSWREFLAKTIIGNLAELLKLNESALSQRLTKEVNTYIEAVIHNELLDWNRVIKDNKFSFKIRLNVASDIARIVGVLTKRIKQVGKYVVEKQLKYLLYSGQTQSNDKTVNETFTKTGEKFNITRNAYVTEISYKKPSQLNSTWTKWYRMALEHWKSAPFRSLEDVPELSLMLKKVSYEAFKKWVDQATKKEPLSRGQTVYDKKEFDYGFYRGGKNEEYIEQGGYNLDTATKTLRWKVRDEVENNDIHGDILHCWDWYYRFMITTWLRDVHNSKLIEEEQDEEGRNTYKSEYSGQRYYFTDGTWHEIQTYQNQSLQDAKVY